MKVVRAAVRRLLAPWRDPPGAAAVLGPQVESIDQRLTSVEASQAALRTDMADLGELPATLHDALALVLERVERLEATLNPSGTDPAP